MHTHPSTRNKGHSDWNPSMGSFSNFQLRLCKSGTQQWDLYKTFSSARTLESHGSIIVLIFGQVLSLFPPIHRFIALAPGWD